MIQEEGVIRLKHEHGKETEQQAHGAVAAGGKDHGHQPHAPGDGEGHGIVGHQRQAVETGGKAERPLGPHAEQEQHQRDEQHVLAAQRRAGLAAGRHEKADGQDQGEQESPQHHAPADGIGSALIQGLQFELLLAAHPVPLAHHQLAFLDLVKDGLHIGHHGFTAALGRLTVERQGRRDRRGKQDVDGPAGVGVEGIFLPQQGRDLGQEGLHIGQRGHFGAQQFRTVVEVADDDPGPSSSGGADVAHETFGQAIPDQRHQGLEEVLLHFRQGQLGQHLFGHPGRQFFHQTADRGLPSRKVRQIFLGSGQRTLGGNRRGRSGRDRGFPGLPDSRRAVLRFGGRRNGFFRHRLDALQALVVGHHVQMMQDPKDAVLEHLIGLHAQVVDRGLEHEHLALPGLAGLHVFHQDVAVSDDVTVRHLPRHIDAAFRRQIGTGQQREEKQGQDQYQQAATAVVTRSQRLPQGHHAGGSSCLFRRCRRH